MGKLEKRFFSKKHRTIITAENKSAPAINKVLKKAIIKGNFILRGGRSSRFTFRFDSIY